MDGLIIKDINQPLIINYNNIIESNKIINNIYTIITKPILYN
jgi:hypothetical protein